MNLGIKIILIPQDFVLFYPYFSVFSKDLEEDIRGDLSGNFERLMVSLCNVNIQGDHQKVI